jgi:[acyl-carrier-protein] S-malonyltransferase
MKKTGFLFPGQGAQKPGMGMDLYERFEEARKLYDIADEILPFSLTELSFRGSHDELKLTKNTQPSIFVHSLAVHAILTANDVHPDVVAGHSVGEYSALTAAGAITFPDALRLVHLRGQLMYRVGKERSGTMAAIIGIDRMRIIDICAGVSSIGTVSPANFNSPDQIVISGDAAGVKAAMEKAVEEGARRAIPLKVSGAFHSELMKPASRQLSEEIDRIPIEKARIPVLSNALGRGVLEPEDIRESLKKQLYSPVLWMDDIRSMIEMGCKCFIETGPGTVLKGLLRRIDRECICYTTDTSETTVKTIEQIASECLTSSENQQ